MLFYSQTRGEFSNADGEIISIGWYAGGDMGTVPEAVNNPAFQFVPDVGPLPQNVYTASPMHVVPRVGPCMTLTPDDPLAMHGRGGMLLHCNNPTRPPRSSSEGCAVAPSLAELNHIAALVEGGENRITVTA